MMTQYQRTPGSTRDRHNDGDLIPAIKAAEMLNVSTEELRRIINQLLDSGSTFIHDRRPNKQGWHILTTSEISFLQREIARQYHADHPEENTPTGGTQMSNVAASTQAQNGNGKDQRDWGQGTGQRYTAADMFQRCGLGISSIPSYCYRGTLPDRRNKLNGRATEDYYFFESDVRTYLENLSPLSPKSPYYKDKAKETETPLPPKAEAPHTLAEQLSYLRTNPNQQPQEEPMTTKTAPAAVPATPTPQPAVVQTSQALAPVPQEQQVGIDVKLMDPRGVAHATQYNRLLEYLYTRVSAIDIEQIEKIAVKVRIDPTILIPIDELNVRIEPKIWCWEVVMTTAQHPEASELYQVVYTDRFRHARAETDSDAS